MIEFISKLDFAVLDFIKMHLNCGFLDAVMPFFSVLGNYGIVWIALTLLLMLSRKYRKAAITMAVSLVLTVVICNLLIKPVVGRVRPYDINTAIQLLIAPPNGYSFPSSHTAASFAAAFALFLYSKKFGVPALILAAVIAFSRMYLYVHYPSDVLAGVAIGIVLALSATGITGFFFRKRSRKRRR